MYVQVGGEKSNQINPPVILGLTEKKVLDGKSRIITELLFLDNVNSATHGIHAKFRQHISSGGFI